MDCIFCSIIKKESPAKIVYENDNVIVFENIKPAAPIHLLIVPKKHIATVNEIKEEDKNLIGDLFIAAQEAARLKNIKDTGYKLAINVGAGGGQEIFHIHIHLLGGWQNEAERESSKV